MHNNYCKNKKKTQNCTEIQSYDKKIIPTRIMIVTVDNEVILIMGGRWKKKDCRMRRPLNVLDSKMITCEALLGQKTQLIYEYIYIQR